MKSIIVVGSINMDIVNFVENHPLPGETIKGYGTEYSPGGKGANQAVAASLAGGNVTMFGAVGRDPFGSELLMSLSRFGVNTDPVSQKEGTSGMAFITVDASGENNIILSAGSNGKLSKEDIDAQLNVLQGAQAVLLQNEIPWETTLYVMKQAKEMNIKIYLNPAPAFRIPDTALQLVDLLIVNETEAEAITGTAVHNAAQATIAAKQLIAAGVWNVIVTLGEQGSLFINASGKTVQTPAFNVKPVDTTAAGDTFIGAFAVANESGLPIEESLKFASAAAAITVTRKGAQVSIPNREEIEAFLKANG